MANLNEASYFHKWADPGEWKEKSFAPGVTLLSKATGRIQITVYSENGHSTWATFGIEKELQYNFLDKGILKFSPVSKEILRLPGMWKLHHGPELSLAECYLADVACWLSCRELSGQATAMGVWHLLYDALKRDALLRKEISIYWPDFIKSLGLENPKP